MNETFETQLFASVIKLYCHYEIYFEMKIYQSLLSATGTSFSRGDFNN